MECYDFGRFLKKKRKENRLSLKAVQRMTQITDSRLSRAEHGDKTIKWTAQDLRALAEVYNVHMVEMCLAAGYLEKADLDQYRKVFSGVDDLNEDEMRNTQEQIHLFVAGRKKNDF